MLHGDFHEDVVHQALAVDNLIVKGSLRTVQILDELLDSALIAEFLLVLGLHPVVPENDIQALCQEGHFPQTHLQGIVIKDSLLKNFLVRQEGHLGSGGFQIAVTDDLQLIDDVAPLIALEIHLSLASDLHLQPFGKSVYDGSAHAVEAAGYLVAPAAEFSAGVQDGKYHLHRRDPGLVVDPYGNAPSIVHHCDRIIRVDRHVDVLTEACQRLIHRIVYNLIHQMVKSAGGGTSNVHTRSFADGLQPFQDLDLICSVFCAHFRSSY